MLENDEEEETRAAHARVGSVVGKYTLDEVIGVGGMAAVYAARHRNRNRVAIKILHSFVASSAQVRSRFLREGYVANTVNHRGVVRVLDDEVTADGAAFLVMELLEGETLDARLTRKGGPISIEEIAPIAVELLDVLAAAHEKGIVHRDIKPENVFITRDGALKVLDFGIARLAETASLAPTNTTPGALMGTPAFMAPEQALGHAHAVDAQTDIYSVGATMFTLLSGDHVHRASAVGEMIARCATQPARPLASAADVPRSIAEVVDRALAFSKADRWPNARAMQEALLAAMAATTTIEFAPFPSRSTPTDAPRGPSHVAAMSLVGTSSGASVPSARRDFRAAIVGGGLAIAVALAGVTGFVLVRKKARATHTPTALDSSFAHEAPPASGPLAVPPAAGAGASATASATTSAVAVASTDAPRASAAPLFRPATPGRVVRKPVPSGSPSPSASAPPAPHYDPLGHQ